MSSLVGFGRRTVSGMLMTSGRQFEDWTANYRLFSHRRCDTGTLFDVVRGGVVNQLSEKTPLVVAMDDSLFRKTGKKTSGVAFRRDPLSPAFNVNFVRGQRFLQVSAALPSGERSCPARMIPIDFCHCPTPKKPGKKAPEQIWKQYRREKKEANISLKGVDRFCALRKNLNNDHGGKNRMLIGTVDGTFTNSTVLKGLPKNTVLIGRIRKDAKLYFLPRPEAEGTRGRKPSYGKRAPTPEALRKDQSVSWRAVTAFATGKQHTFYLKTITPIKWRTAGAQHNLRLVVIRPLAYRLTKNSRVLYRQPAYLICTDPQLPLKQIVQFYIWRWGIEVNFRDEKSILGVGQAQVRNPESVERVPAFIIAAYGMMLLATRRAFGAGEHITDSLPKAKWRQNEKTKRASTQQLINHLRAELWGKAMGLDNFSGFIDQAISRTKPEKLRPHLQSAVLYAHA